MDRGIIKMEAHWLERSLIFSLLNHMDKKSAICRERKGLKRIYVFVFVFVYLVFFYLFISKINEFNPEQNTEQAA